jgi:hypothetical protein
MTTNQMGPCDRATKCHCATGSSGERPGCSCVEERRLQDEYESFLADAEMGSRAALIGWRDTINALAKLRDAI